MPPSDAAADVKRGECQPTYPQCPACDCEGQVQPLALADLSPGVQYFRCARCGFVWGTRDYDIVS
jgi:hypothetical protein